MSGDGRTNDGPPAEIVRDKLVSQGIVVNGLPVMMNRSNFGRPPDLTLDKYYEESVIGGPGSFLIVADNFDHFGRAVRTKLVREISATDGPRALLACLIAPISLGPDCRKPHHRRCNGRRGWSSRRCWRTTRSPRRGST